jgi:hypothetical protein
MRVFPSGISMTGTSSRREVQFKTPETFRRKRSPITTIHCGGLEYRRPLEFTLQRARRRIEIQHARTIRILPLSATLAQAGAALHLSFPLSPCLRLIFSVASLGGPAKPSLAMQSFELYNRLTEWNLGTQDCRRNLLEFAEINGWTPSDAVPEERDQSPSSGHLVVEHGMDNTAVITFLRHGNPFNQLQLSQQIDILSLSYNNLVDWHLFPDRDGLLLVHNRTKPISQKRVSIADNRAAWHSQSFD